MTEPTTIVCLQCGDGADPSQYPLEALYQKAARICPAYMDPTHQFRDQDNKWKPCILHAIDPRKPGQLEVRNLENAQIITVSETRMREYDSDTQDRAAQKEMPEPCTDSSADKQQGEQEEIRPYNSHNNNRKSTEKINVSEESDGKEALEPEAQARKQSSVSEPLDKKTEALIQRNIQIYKKLKELSVTDDPEAFKLIYESTIISANNETRKEDNQNTTICNKQNDGDSYTKRLHQETTIRPFTEKYPTSEQEYYKYSAIISTYANEHDEIPERRLLQEVMKKCIDSERRRWNRWKENKATDILQNSNDDKTKHQVLQSL